GSSGNISSCSRFRSAGAASRIRRMHRMRRRDGDLDHAREEQAMTGRVAIVGSGLIGRAWAAVFAGGGWDVALYDAGAGGADEGRMLVAQALTELAADGLVEDAGAAAARVRVARRLPDALEGAGFVQENTPERVEVKRAIFAELDRLAAPDAVLASSTSTIV